MSYSSMCPEHPVNGSSWGEDKACLLQASQYRAFLFFVQEAKKRIGTMLNEEDKIDGLENVEVKVFK